MRSKGRFLKTYKMMHSELLETLKKTFLVLVKGDLERQKDSHSQPDLGLLK